MTDADRYKLLFGPYRPPKCRVGRFLRCHVRGRLRVKGFTDAPIPWPVAGGRPGRWQVIVCGSLVKAIRRESEIAVAHHWGISDQTVWAWRKSLGVGATTEGTSRLRRDHFAEPWGEAAREKAWGKAQDPERRAKIAAARRGKPRPRHVVEAVARASRRRRPSEEARRKMSEAHRRRGTRPPKAGRPWSAEEDELVRALPAREVADLTGRTLTAVYSRRAELGMPDGRRRDNKA